MLAIWTAIKGFFSSIRMYLIIAAVVAALSGVVYLYWQHLENKIDTLTQQNAILKSANEENDKTIKTLQKNFQETQKKLDNLNKSYQKIDDSEDKIKKSLTIDNLNKDNHSVIVKQINNNVNGVFNDLEKQSDPSAF